MNDGDCRNRTIDEVMAKSISRFGRNTVGSLNAVSELKLIGIEVVRMS